MENAPVTVSLASTGDTETLVKHRLAMWRDLRPELGEKIAESERLTRDWILEKLSQGELAGFIARLPDGRVAGSCCVWVREEVPRPTSTRLEGPYLMSMYTEKEFRRKGVGRSVVEAAVRWCRDRGFERVSLHASEEGEPLYELLGFAGTSEMRLKL